MNDDYQTYKQEYDHSLSRVRSFLSSNVRSQTTLKECDRLIAQARRNATAMAQIAEESGDAFQIQECKRRFEQELDPLWQEVDRATKQRNNGDEMMMMHQNHQRADLFSGGSGYRAPNPDGNGNTNGNNNGLFGGDDNQDNDMEMLIRNSEDLLLESQRLCHSSEQTGAETLSLMGRQREQLQNASDHLAGARASLAQAKDVLRAMTRKALRNKRFLQGVVAVLIMANILVFIADVKKKLGKRSKNNPDDDGGN